MSELIVVKGTLKIPGEDRYVRRGETVPEGAISGEAALELIEAGILAESSEDGAREARGSRSRPAGRWAYDPAALAGKTAEQLRAMVLDVQKDLDVEDLDVPALLQLLTSDFDPLGGRAPEARSADRHRPGPEALKAARRRAAPSFVQEEEPR